MFAGKPIIGVAGGIGSGKSLAASIFGEMGCVVISSDELVRRAYGSPEVRETLRRWWGDEVIAAGGEIDRPAVGRRIFADIREKERLERLIHPIVARERERMMRAAASFPETLAFLWDSPLLFETALNEQCDAVVFIDAPEALRARRVRENRGWQVAELHRRENLQLPLDKKHQLSDYVIGNTADVEELRDQVRDVLSRILAEFSSGCSG